MLRFFCPSCWEEFLQRPDICPRCRYRIKDDKEKDYTDKLIDALGHKAQEIRFRAVMILALKKEKAALPHLKRILNNSNELGLKKAVLKAIMLIEDNQTFK